jgi:hypothetical protein
VTRTLVCPNGHRFREPKLVYGLPSPVAMRDAEVGRIVLGGSDPTLVQEFACPSCGEPVASGVASSEPALKLRTL